MSGFPYSELTLSVAENLERCTTVCTIEISKERQIDIPPPPPCAVIGEDWISLQDRMDASRLTDLGYLQLEPEGLAMKFMRLAWLAAQHEIRSKQKPFDGDPRPDWEK